jgi:hypothetical protein
VLWFYLGVTLATLVAVLFGSPQGGKTSDHWGWLAAALAWLLVGSSLALFTFMAPLGNAYTWITERLTRRAERQEQQWCLLLARIGGGDRPRGTWRHYERIVRRYATCVVLAAVVLTAGGVYGLAKTDWGRTLPTWLGGLPKTSEAASTRHVSYVAAEAVSAVVVPWSVLLRAAMAPSRADTHVGRHRSGG